MTLKTVAVAVLFFAREIMAKDEVKMNLLLSAFGPLVLSMKCLKNSENYCSLKFAIFSLFMEKFFFKSAFDHKLNVIG